MANNAELISQCEQKARTWLTPAFDEETQNAVKALLDADDKTELIDSFIKIWNLAREVFVVSWGRLQPNEYLYGRYGYPRLR